MSNKVNVSREPAEETSLIQEAGQSPVVAENWPVQQPDLGDIFKSDVKTTDPTPATNAENDEANDSEKDTSNKNDSAQSDRTINSA